MTPTATDPGNRARALWAASEPFVLGLVFAPEARDALTGLGVSERAVYFVVRSAPLGRADAAVVAAAFHGFPVSLIASLVPGIWDHIDPAEAIAAHHASLPITARRVFGDAIDLHELTRFADLLTGLASGVDTAGRPLAAGNQALAVPVEPWARLWHACTTLREYRGDAHVAALVTADLTVAESLVLTAAWADGHIETDLLRSSRQLSDQAWHDAQTALAERGLLTPQGALSADGAVFRDRIETHTDLASQRPWRTLSDTDLADSYAFLTRLSTHMVETSAMRAVTPVGAPWPPPPLVP